MVEAFDAEHYLCLQKKKVLPLQTPLSGCYVIWSHDSVCYTDIEISAPASDLTCFFHRISARDASLICSTAFPFVFIFLRRTARALFFLLPYIHRYLFVTFNDIIFLKQAQEKNPEKSRFSRLPITFGIRLAGDHFRPRDAHMHSHTFAARRTSLRIE